MIGRVFQKEQLERILKRERSAFVAVTGRRRVGKTYLIDHELESHMCFRLTGIQGASKQQQIQNFIAKLSEYQRTYHVTPNNWQEVFILFKQFLQGLKKTKKQIIFIDELPWIATKRSGFLQILAHLWNDFLSKENHFVLVVCGSSTSWLNEQIVNNKGGLHNRLTDIINLKPFTLTETKAFFISKNIQLTLQEIAKIYMAFGGVPYYLEQVRKGENATTTIARNCFSDEGLLKNEYQNLYKALFDNAHLHEALVATLATSNTGLTRSEILKKTSLKDGGTLTRTINDLLLTGFISEFIPFGKAKRGVRYKLTDEYSIFYLRFIKPNKKITQSAWQHIASSQTYKIWMGYAFENLCFKHADNIKKSLGISGVNTQLSSLYVSRNKEQTGFQIDMLIDRADNTINLCEMKFYDTPYQLTRKKADDLLKKKYLFKIFTKTRKQLFITLVSNHQLISNAYSQEVIDSVVSLERLFDA